MILGEAHLHGQWKYASEGRRIVSALWVNDRGEVEARETYTYGTDGLSAIRYRENVGEWRHTYDDTGREVRVSGGPYSSAGVETTEYDYDRDGYIRGIETRGVIRSVITFERE